MTVIKTRFYITEQNVFLALQFICEAVSVFEEKYRNRGFKGACK